MRLIAGLGNPGKRYEGTRHNIGFRVLEILADREWSEAGAKKWQKGFSSLWTKGDIRGEQVLCLLPQTFMNLSGKAVQEAMHFYRLTPKEVMVVHDELDLPLGRIKPAFDSGAAGHRGVGSTIEQLGTKAFHRLRMGIGRPSRPEEVESYVLSSFGSEEGEVVLKMTETAVELLKTWVSNPNE